jgi:hypothetical protein
MSAASTMSESTGPPTWPRDAAAPAAVTSTMLSLARSASLVGVLVRDGGCLGIGNPCAKFTLSSRV